MPVRACVCVCAHPGAVFACESGDDGYAGRLPAPPPPNVHGQLGRSGALAHTF